MNIHTDLLTDTEIESTFALPPGSFALVAAAAHLAPITVTKDGATKTGYYRATVNTRLQLPLVRALVANLQHAKAEQTERSQQA